MAETWRDIARPIIHQTIQKNAGKGKKEVRKALREAYPFGEREYWPYKVWCGEVRVQLGEKPEAEPKKDPNQLELF